MVVLVTGAGGFIGSAIVEALLAAGHRVLACARDPGNLPQAASRGCVAMDMRSLTTSDAWKPLLDGVDAVVNCAGILRETQAGEFDRIHVEAPRALAQACQSVGVGKYIQISAIGSPDDGAFIASKHRFDDWLLRSGVTATVIRPSVVMSLRGSYGGTSMLRALAAMPGIVLLPGKGEQLVQPVLLEDLAQLVVLCLPADVAAGECLYAAGPAPMRFRDLLAGLRGWLRFAPARQVSVPLPLVWLMARVGEAFGRGPLGQTMTGMLERGNVAPPGAWEQAHASTGLRMRAVDTAFSTGASFVQDRWHARLYLLLPLIWLALIVLWLVSGLAGLLAPSEAWQVVLTPTGIPVPLHEPLVVAAGAFDLALAVGLFLLWRVRLLLWVMLVAVLVYSIVLGVGAPGLWLEPLGSLVKNLPILVLLLIALVLESGR